MEYLFMDNLEKQTSFIKCLEEDLDDQSALIMWSIVLNFLDQNLDAIAYLMYIDKNPYSEIAWHQMGRLYWSKDYENAIML
jgi:hypothetical protein